MSVGAKPSDEVRQSPSNAIGPFRLAVACALVAGWLENVLTFWPRLTAESLIGTDWNSLWITPTSNLFFLGVAAVLVAALRRIVPWDVTKLANSALVVLAAFGIGWFFYPRLNRIAIVLLALGAGVQIGRLIAGRPGQAYRAARLATLVLAVVTIGSAIIGLGAPAVRQSLAMRALPPAAAGAPNVLLIILDTVRASSLSMFGAQRPTSPNLDRWASRGTAFSNAYAVVPWSLPSHASILTGKYGFEMEADWRRPLEPTATLATVLRDQGYRSGGFVANLTYTSAETGLAQGFGAYKDWPITPMRVLAGSSLGSFVLNNPGFRGLVDYYLPWTWKTADTVADEFLEWHDKTDNGRPFFAFLNVFDAHDPYLPPAPYATMFGADEGRGRRVPFWKGPPPMNLQVGGVRPEPLTEEEARGEERAYEGGIAYLDSVIERLLLELDSRGVLDSTIVIVTSDHGEAFGEFGVFGHTTALYPPMLHVPLVIIYPKSVPAGAVVDDAVSLRDLANTILDVAGVPGSPLPGSSLGQFWRTNAEPSRLPPSPILSELWAPAGQEPPWAPVRYGYMRSMIEWPYLFIRRGDGQEETMSLDPAQAADPPRERLRNSLEAMPPNPHSWRVEDGAAPGPTVQ